ESLHCLAGLRSSSEHWHNQDPKTAENIKASVLCRILKKMAHNHPLILVLEDVHWAHEDLDVFLSQFERHVSGCQTFLLLSSREKKCRYPASCLELGPLRNNDVQALLD